MTGRVAAMRGCLGAAFVLAAGVLLSACGSWSSSKADVTVTGTTTISRGQELTDLKRALDEGAISRRDYDKVREKILRRD
jgi:hypothetical protein